MLDKTNCIVDDLAAEIGFTATNALIDLLGGSNLCVPTTVREDHYLVRIIGLPALRRLVANWPGELIWLPDGRWRDVDRLARRVVVMYLAGKKTREIAEKTGLKMRRVQRIFKELEEAGLIPVIGEAKDVVLRCFEEIERINSAVKEDDPEIPTENAS